MIAQTKYILPTKLKPVFRLLLKSKDLNDLTTSPKVHSTDSLTELIELLKACIAGVIAFCLNGTCRCTRIG